MDTEWELLTKPLTPTRQGIINIIRSAVLKTREVLPEEFDWNEAAQIIMNHSIEGLAFFGLKYMGVVIPKWLQSSFVKETVFEERLWKSANSVMDEFTHEKIEFLPLKGFVIKDLYPSKYMRHMCDVDILIRENEYESKVKPVMNKLGWNEKYCTDNECIWGKENLTIELHKQLISISHEVLHVPDSWEWIHQGNEYTFVFLHFIKHYYAYGIGISHLVDFFFCDHLINRSAIKKYEQFYMNICSVIDSWFNGKPYSEKDLFLTNFLFDNMEFGSMEIEEKASAFKKIVSVGGDRTKARLIDLRHAIMLDWDSRKKRNPVLKKVPVLLPFIWLWRLVVVITTKDIRQYYQKTRESMKTIIIKIFLNMLAYLNLAKKFCLISESMNKL